MALHEFERRLERVVEGVSAKLFRSRLTPVEVARRIAREMDVRRTVGVRGVIAPNRLVVQLGQEDMDLFADMARTLTTDWAAYAREHAREEGFVLVGPVTVEIEVVPSLRSGQFRVQSEMAEGDTVGPPAAVVLPDGRRVEVGEEPVLIGRSADCDIHLDRKEISRHHAEIRRQEGGVVIVDLESLNGTKVNGAGVRERDLTDGDQIEVGKVVTLRLEMT